MTPGGFPTRLVLGGVRKILAYGPSCAPLWGLSEAQTQSGKLERNVLLFCFPVVKMCYKLVATSIVDHIANTANTHTHTHKDFN